jgi:peptidyl-prolyl cis-trans isomerase D
MSIIQNIREKGTWIIFGIIALALIAFILQDGIGRNNRNSNISTIATVNGDPIDKLSFDEKVDLQVQNYASQGVKREQVIGYQFNQEVDALLYKQEINKLGLMVGTKEISDVLFGSESPFKNEFTDQTTGEFKVNDAKNAIAQLKKSKNAEQIKQLEKFYIEPSIENRIRTKYQSLLIKGIQLPKWLADKSIAEANSIASVSYVGVSYNSVSDSAVKVTNDDIAAYIKDHAPAYQNEEASRSISYVGFNAAASTADSVAILNQLIALKDEFKATTNEASFLNKVGSDLPFYNSYVSKKTLQIPNKDSVLGVGVGNTFGPYIDGKNFTIAKVIGVKSWPDSASVRHILIATVNPQNGQQIRDDSTAKKLIDSIKNAVAGGASFEAMVTKYSDDGGSKANGGKYEMFAQAQMTPAFNDYSFDNAVGSKGVVKTDFGYHYIEVLKQTPRGPAYKIAYLSKAVLPSNETLNAASTAAAQFASASKDPKSFTANAVKEKKEVFPAANIKANDNEIPGIGETRQMVRWIFENDINDVSEPFEVGDNYVVAMINSEEKKGLMSVEAAKPTVENIIKDQKKAEIIKKTFKGTSLETYAAAAKVTIARADSINFNYSMVPGLGNEPKMVGAAFNKSLVNKVSEPFAGNSGVFVVSVNSIGAIQSQQDPNLFKDELLNRTRSIFFRSSVGLRKAAKIEDNRFKIY